MPQAPERQARRPGTLGDMFSKAMSYGPALWGGKGGAAGGRRQGRPFPSFGPRRGPQIPSTGPGYEWQEPPQPAWPGQPPQAEGPGPKGPYRRNTAGVVGDLRSALDAMPFVPGKRGIRDRILHPRPTEGPGAIPGDRPSRVPGWLQSLRQELQARVYPRSAPPEELWTAPQDYYGGPGPVAAPPPMYQDWEAQAPPQGGGWDFASAAPPPPAAPAHDPWRDPVMYDAPPAYNQYGGAGIDSRYDTGHGWSVVTSTVHDDPSRSYVRLNAVQPNAGNIAVRILGELTRFTFNLLLLGIILTILAIPTAIGLSRVAGLSLPIPWNVISPTPRPIPTPYPGYRTYNGSSYSIAYPSSWKATAASDPLQLGITVQGEGFFGPPNVSLAVAVHSVFPKDQLNNLLDSAPAAFSGGQTANFQILVTPRAGPTMDGQRWQWEQFTYDLSDGRGTTQMEAVVLMTNQGLYTYVIVYRAPASQFDDTKAKVFDPMVGSFRFPF